MTKLIPANVEVKGGSGTTQFVDSAIKQCSQIATLPAVAVEIIRLTDDPGSTMEDLNRVISNDPALGMRILKLVNSAFYGMPGKVNSINRAILLLGLKAVKNISIAASLVKLFRGGPISKDFDAAALWTHSIAVATGASLLAKQSDLVSADEAFLAGLIHDIGILVELQNSRPKFAQLLEKLAADEQLTFRHAEEATFGASHEAFGEGLCKAWNFPSNLQFVAGYHHRPGELAEAHRRLPALVHTADVLVAKLGLGYTRTVETQTVDSQLLGLLRLTEANLAAVTSELPAAMVQTQQMFEAPGKQPGAR